MTPSEVGERAEAAVIDALVQAGHTVYLPLGSSQRADLVFENAEGLHRVQVKSGVVRDRVVVFATCSHTGSQLKDYRRDVEFFAVYCHVLESVFLVPVDAVPLRSGTLRLTSTRNGQRQGIRWAEQFRLEWSPPALEEGFTIEAPPEPPGG